MLRLLAALETQLRHTPFALGDAPCAVDCTLHGLLRGHLLRDPSAAALVRQRFPRLTQWAGGVDCGVDSTRIEAGGAGSSSDS